MLQLTCFTRLRRNYLFQFGCIHWKFDSNFMRNSLYYMAEDTKSLMMNAEQDSGNDQSLTLPAPYGENVCVAKPSINEGTAGFSKSETISVPSQPTSISGYSMAVQTVQLQGDLPILYRGPDFEAGKNYDKYIAVGLITVLCCWPFGLCATYYAMQITKQNKTGRVMGNCYSTDHITEDYIHKGITCNIEEKQQKYRFGTAKISAIYRADDETALYTSRATSLIVWAVFTGFLGLICVVLGCIRI